MAQGYADQAVGVLDGTLNPPAKADGRLVNAKLYRFRAVLDLSSANVKHANGDTNVLFQVPRGLAFSYGILNPSTGMGGTATIAIGNAGTAGKYRAAAIANAAGPVLFGLSSAADDDPLSADEQVIMTWAAADGPSSGILVVDMFYSAA